MAMGLYEEFLGSTFGVRLKVWIKSTFTLNLWPCFSPSVIVLYYRS